MNISFKFLAVALSITATSIVLTGCGGSGTPPPVSAVTVTPVQHPVQTNDQWTFNTQATKTVGGVVTPVVITQTTTVNSVTPGATFSTVNETNQMKVTAGGKTTTNTATIVYQQDNTTGNLVEVSTTSGGVTTTFARTPATLGIPGTFTAGFTEAGTITANDGSGTYTITETFKIIDKSTTFITAGDRQWQAWNCTLDWASTAKTGLVKRKAQILYVPGIGQAISTVEDDTNADGSTEHIETGYNTTTVTH